MIFSKKSYILLDIIIFVAILFFVIWLSYYIVHNFAYENKFSIPSKNDLIVTLILSIPIILSSLGMAKWYSIRGKSIKALVDATLAFSAAIVAFRLFSDGAPALIDYINKYLAIELLLAFKVILMIFVFAKFLISLIEIFQERVKESSIIYDSKDPNQKNESKELTYENGEHNKYIISFVVLASIYLYLNKKS
ncbi:UNVERIFIED_ORG: hypothetical protein C7429_102611 [Pantoea allii]|jgi:hypothetical protein|uniref:hypothetical protein n=1 Tax=Enterobacter agglomerans TaxID=549 RepID=UPI0010EB0585